MKQNHTATRLGWTLIIISTVLWLVPLATPVLPFSVKIKILIGGGAVVLAEGLFWLGAIFVGKEAVKRYRKSFRFLKWNRNRGEVKQDTGDNQ